MNWDIMKKAWNIAKQAYPDRSIWIDFPTHIGQTGEFIIEDLSSNKQIDKMLYMILAKNNNTYLKISVGNSSFEELVGKEKTKNIQIKSAFIENKSNNVIFAEKSSNEPKFMKRERVRINDDFSMEHKELCTIFEIKGNKENGYFYLVRPDGSETLMWITEQKLSPNMAGHIPNV